jgi:hypothetical protein
LSEGKLWWGWRGNVDSFDARPRLLGDGSSSSTSQHLFTIVCRK